MSTLVFATLHGGKVTHVSQYGYYVIAGLVLGTVYALTGELALPMGFHVFYNFSQGFLGLGVSQVTPELVVLELAGPDKWVGEEGSSMFPSRSLVVSCFSRISAGRMGSYK
ncbi:CPBP family intramembrane glutamic endopeptidase [Halomicroarcula sp. GCM10025709]|uniref:CPBP family intramembrane glutamic endopeptidase n=1 Tax=Halomicroarcula sp. GCM10025709 TaxID=3252669 RepID=UPI003613A6F9